MPVPSHLGSSHAPEGWASPPARPALGGDEVHAWWIDLRAGGDPEVLSADERARAERLRMPNHRERYIAAHSGLRSILARYVGDRPRRLAFETARGGKPRLAGKTSWQFNLSHSGDVALVAIASGRAVGIDVECLRRMDDAAGIVARFFSDGERRAFEATPADSRIDAFFRIWTRKESYLKALGVGLSGGLDAFDVSASPESTILLGPDGDSYQLTDLDCRPDHRAALAAEGSGWNVLRWRYRADS